MITVISKRNKIAAEIICDINNLKNSELKKIKFALNNFGMIYFRNQNLSSSNYLKFAKKLGIPADYPRLKGLSSKYTKITVVERKLKTKDQVLENNSILTQFIQKTHPRLLCCYRNWYLRKVKQTQSFLHNT